jgi:hypothetical protein
MIQDLVDLSVDLCLAQLIREKAIKTTWPRVQPHLGHPLSEQLNPTIEKYPQEVHARQSLPS